MSYPSQYRPAPAAYPPPQPAYGHAYGQPAYGPPVLTCRVCGCGPAVKTTFRGHRGLILLMQFRSVEGPFCRDCGLAVFRDLTSATMWQGWWGVASAVITPIIILLNLVRHGSVAGLPAPQPGPHGMGRRPLNPGAPLFARPGTIIGLVLVTAAFLFFVVAIATG